MFDKARKTIGIEKDAKFVEKVLILSFPTALLFLLLSSTGLVTPILAILSLASVVVFNILLLFPLTLELQKVKKYVKAMSEGQNFEEYKMSLSEKDTKEIIADINKMHSFWAQKTDILEAQTLSDTAILDSLPDPVMMIDTVGNITGANLAARNIFGKKITEKNIEKVFKSESFINSVSKVLKKESKSENLIFYINNPINQKLYAHIKQLPWVSKGKAVAVISIYDLTKSLKIEKMQSDFVANASHELRTPLSVISGFIETLQTSAKDDNDAREKFLKIMADQAEYMSLLIENLLSLSKIELNQDLAPNETIDIIELIEEASQALSIKAQAKNMNIILDLNSDIPLINADKAQIKQLIQNLTDNAIKYGLANSNIGIKVALKSESSDKQSVTIAINNKGPKIEDKDIARLTERFFRLQEHKNQNIKGNGLGLAIAKHIVIRHKGNLTVASSNIKGTTFTIYLPLVEHQI